MEFSIWLLYVTATLSNIETRPASNPTNLAKVVRCMFTDNEGTVNCTLPVVEFWLCLALTVAEKGLRGTFKFHCTLD